MSSAGGSFSHMSLHVGSDWMTRCSTYGELLKVAPGLVETGQPWVIDFRAVPHWLNAGATQSGKSNLANAIIKGLAPQPVALVGFDLKGGVEFTPYWPRMSALATTRAECGELLDDLVRVLADRMRLCRAYGARNIWRLPDDLRPVPVVVLVDEVAEAAAWQYAYLTPSWAALTATGPVALDGHAADFGAPEAA